MAIPVLSTAEQIDYLVQRSMIASAEVSEQDILWLSGHNFHFVVGYARNLRDMARTGLVESDGSFCELRGLVESDNELAGFMAQWLRRAELYLREVVVRAYTDVYGHGEGFLDSARFDEATPARHVGTVQREVADDIAKFREPYVQDYLRAAAARHGMDLPGRANGKNVARWLQLLDALPLWAAIDSFSLGAVGKYVRALEQFRGVYPGARTHMARELGITPRKLDVTIESLSITRNLIFHQQRLWMRPMPKSPGLPKDLARRYPDIDFDGDFKESHMVALLAIAKLLPHEVRDGYLDQLDGFLTSRPLLARGIVTAPFAELKQWRAQNK